MIEKTIKFLMGIILLLSFVLIGLLISNKQTTKSTTTLEKITMIEISGTETKLMGSWVELIPHRKEYQGFTLYSDGTASSINTGKLLYKEWKIRGNKLNLLVESKDMGIDSQDIETYAIEKISQDKLLLKIGKSTFTYRRV